MQEVWQNIYTEYRKHGNVFPHDKRTWRQTIYGEDIKNDTLSVQTQLIT